ncbi:MAG: hypothetical protein K6G37_01160 [Bacilli bacterium]|nr:hypothetical protein [Bacilli bacterium]
MKKVAVLGLTSLFLLTGCGSKNNVVCTGSTNEGGEKISMKVTGSLKGDKIEKVSAKLTFGSKDKAKQYCSIFELANSMASDSKDKIDVKCSGKSIEFKDYTKVSSDDSIIGASKADFIKAMEEQELKCK